MLLWWYPVTVSQLYLDAVCDFDSTQWFVVFSPHYDCTVFVCNNAPQGHVLTQQNFLIFGMLYYRRLGVIYIYER